jgi:hypothetical protein
MTTALFSVLLPHKHIPPHRGPWKGVLRYHLALRTPADETAARIRVVAAWSSMTRSSTKSGTTATRSASYCSSTSFASCRGTWRHRTVLLSGPFGGRRSSNVRSPTTRHGRKPSEARSPARRRRPTTARWGGSFVRRARHPLRVLSARLNAGPGPGLFELEGQFQ